MRPMLESRILGRRIAALFAALSLVASVVVACSSSNDDSVELAALSAGCIINSDCTTPYVCAFKTCHVACNSSRDCQPLPGTRCVESDKPFHVCLNAKETSCVRNSDCPGSEVCGVDLQCRDACETDRDCLSSQVCTSGVCADTTDLNDAGQLPVREESDASSTCVHSSDCPGTLVCVRGSCGVECETAKDCPVSWSCFETRCAPPGYGEAGASDAAGSSPVDSGPSLPSDAASDGPSDAANDG